jgi:hypothetical protein
VAFTYAIVSPPSHGTLSAINQPAGSLVYVSQLGFHGTDTFTYRAIDAGGASNTATSTITVPRPIGTLAFAALSWNFDAHRAYSTVVSMAASALPIGAKIVVSCRRHRCRFRPKTVTVTKGPACKRKRSRCRRKHAGHKRSVDLAPLFNGSRFPVGAILTVRFEKSGFVGKVYRLQIRPEQQPAPIINCLAPGSIVPGKGC